MTMTTSSVFAKQQRPEFLMYRSLLERYDQAKSQGANSEITDKIKTEMDQLYMKLTQNEINELNQFRSPKV